MKISSFSSVKFSRIAGNLHLFLKNNICHLFRFHEAQREVSFFLKTKQVGTNHPPKDPDHPQGLKGATISLQQKGWPDVTFVGTKNDSTIQENGNFYCFFFTKYRTTFNYMSCINYFETHIDNNKESYITIENWVVVSNMFYFHPENWGKEIPILTSIFFQLGWFNHQLERKGRPQIANLKTYSTLALSTPTQLSKNGILGDGFKYFLCSTRKLGKMNPI